MPLYASPTAGGTAPSQPTGAALVLLEVDRRRIGVLPPHGLSGNKERDRVRPRSVNKELRYVRSRVPCSAYFVGGEQSEIPIRIGKFCGNVV
jgi:hypothetical protein